MIFVTGGAGYIGSHTCVELLASGQDVTVFDNFSNASEESLVRVEKITGRKVKLVRGDIRDREALVRALRDCEARQVIHFAGLKAVGESVAQPLKYYDNNIAGSIHLLEAMDEVGVRSIVFSSSATVYGDPVQLPIPEDHPLSATNPYGQSKLFIETMLRDLHRSNPAWRIAILRYFNPVGAHVSGLIGEDPQGTPNNLMPFVTQVAVGQRQHVNVWGSDYPTPDGTGVRDYIHVVDLALGHLKALQWLEKNEGCVSVNLGTGRGYSVLEMIEALAGVSGKSIPYQLSPRRPGDVASCFADPGRAKSLLGWEAERGLEAMCADAWRWQAGNPQGYRS